MTSPMITHCKRARRRRGLKALSKALLAPVAGVLVVPVLWAWIVILWAVFGR